MANIGHRLSIDAPPARVRQLIATEEGMERWWTGRPVVTPARRCRSRARASSRAAFASAFVRYEVPF